MTDTPDTLDAQAPASDYLVLVNAEEQHSIWLAAVDIPAGWSVVHRAATQQEAIAYVDANWTDMRPASLR
ncbi:MbtH family NRPS accessory protein [Paraburkholderia sp. NMBU_R16]|uniref:MbtH family protein n=1 Tax=Paraburkholderia sp. NMBU_R16 TaxID=2698676 RepID=UPI0015669124|nr:MbtH family NRPS accessory protein [Paraburkholderia sp. NMBU_R16]NRO98356.1 MbtH family NRPS accessory protein [Paraburkholderia sp. NMBU_R16]